MQYLLYHKKTHDMISWQQLFVDDIELQHLHILRVKMMRT